MEGNKKPAKIYFSPTKSMGDQLACHTPMNVVNAAIVVTFAFLWAIWIQPHTIALRYFLLVFGFFLGGFLLSRNLKTFYSKVAMPIYIIFFLFLWTSAHLFLFSHQYYLQVHEYLSFWKTVALGVPFALGVGIVIGQGQADKKKVFENSRKSFLNKAIWWIFYIGIVAPTIIYVIKIIMMTLSTKYQWNLPMLMIHAPSSSSFYIPKTGHVFYCLPALALACSQIDRIFSDKLKNNLLPLVIYISTIILALIAFYFGNIKNGIAYSFFIISFLIIKILINERNSLRLHHFLLIIFLFVGMATVFSMHTKKDNAWSSLLSDIRVASNIEQNDEWKYYDGESAPINENGKKVSLTNYYRASWAIVAVDLIKTNPLGYGLIDSSFGHLARERWPESRLTEAHSGWLDLMLGIGVPGVILLIAAGIVAIKNIYKLSCTFYETGMIWILGGQALLMISTEVSKEIYIQSLIFLIMIMTGLGINSKPPNFMDKNKESILK